MALQTSQFTTIGLGVRNDMPPDPIQPKLVDGIHLRWAFQRELGFPWYGFSLFRREHREGKPVCLSEALKEPAAPNTTLSTPLGQLVSDRPLRFTNDFPPVAVPELDLDGRSFLRLKLAPSMLARRVRCTVGFRGDGLSVGECVRFFERKEDKEKNPREERKFEFEVRDARRALAAATRVTIVDTTSGKLSGLDCGHFLAVTLPAAAEWLEVTLTHFAKPAEIEALDAAGARVASAVMQNPARTPERIMLRGRGILRIVIRAPQDETTLHEICFGAGGESGKRTVARVAGYLATVRVASAVASGHPGDVVTVELEADAISRIDIDRATAALIDLCVMPVAQGARDGWKALQGFPYALSLPVTHPHYPASGNQPQNLAGAEALAVGRILYGAPAGWGGASFADLHAELVRLVQGGPGGAPPMAEVLSPPEGGVPDPPDPAHPPPTMTQRRTLDIVLLASLNPAAAQMLGLYWVDQTAIPGTHYDYLVVADYKAGHASAADVLNEINANGFANLEGYIVFNKVAAPAPAIAPPENPRAYALPGTVRMLADGTTDDASNNAGLRWQIPSAGMGVLVPGAAVMYHVWRASLGNGTNPSGTAAFSALTVGAPLLVVEPILAPGEEPVGPDDWPPFPVHFLDQGLAEGWYGYRVSGLDIFGRLSAQSPSAPWYEWAPVPDPRPWYYTDPAGDRAIHASAVRLLDKIPPPPPTGIEAFAMDPDDPFLLRDAAYNTWKATLSAAERDTLVGLRVRWQWTQAHMRQAPDTKEFRIYYQSGRLNALAGEVTAVATASSVESNVTTDLANTQSADAYADAHLRIGSDAYPIVGSGAGTPLQVRVRHIGLTETAGTVTVASGSAIVTGAGTSWHAGMTGLRFQLVGEAASYRILAIASATQLTLERVYVGASAAGTAYATFDRRPTAPASGTVAIPAAYAVGSVSTAAGSATVAGTGTTWRSAFVGQLIRIEGDPSAYRIQTVPTPTQLTLNKPFAGSAGDGKTYAISFPIFTDYATPTNWERRYYVVGYDEHVTVTTDANGAPLHEYEVLLPTAADADRAGVPLVTTLAAPISYAHVSVSATDDKTHTADAPKWTGTSWGDRTGNEGDPGAPAAIYLVRRDLPQPPAPPADSERVFATPADYHSLSYFTFRWRAEDHLKTHVFRALDDAIFKTDWAKRVRERFVLQDGQIEFFPSETTEPRWNILKRQQVAEELNQLNPLAEDPPRPLPAAVVYRGLSDDALRVLAGLPGNERAFVQLTVTPLDPNDPEATADRRGPDNDADYAVNPLLRIYTDALDGRSTNRYFYRAAYVDGANNRSPLSISSPPVWLPNVVAPRAPVITKVLGGERRITLSWASNREADLAEYQVYRADSEDATRDLSLMNVVHVEVVAAGDPAGRPREVSWVDDVPGLLTFYYRVVAVDEAGNASPPSVTFAGRAFDESLPVPPTLALAFVDVGGGVLRAEARWTSADEVTLQRRTSGGSAAWSNRAVWQPPGAYVVVEDDTDPTRSYEYRVRARKGTGATALGSTVTLTSVQ
jgi:hypothetical protein